VTKCQRYKRASFINVDIVIFRFPELDWLVRGITPGGGVKGEAA
jgi:hypothetical protein